MLRPTQIAQFSARGYLALESVFSAGEIEEVRTLLDPLFQRLGSLPAALVNDLAGGRTDSQPMRSPELNRPSTLEPGLRQTRVYRRCLAMAAQIAGRHTKYVFDHAIYKSPRNAAPTPWHQDHAYNGHRRLLRTVHFWIPLQPVTVESGCMHFVPRSHHSGLLRHERHAQGPALQVRRDDWSEAVPCPLREGGVTLHTPLTLHFTGPNRSSGVRRAWILHFGPWGRWSKLHPSILLDKLSGRNPALDESR